MKTQKPRHTDKDLSCETSGNDKIKLRRKILKKKKEKVEGLRVCIWWNERGQLPHRLFSFQSQSQGSRNSDISALADAKRQINSYSLHLYITICKSSLMFYLIGPHSSTFYKNCGQFVLSDLLKVTELWTKHIYHFQPRTLCPILFLHHHVNSERIWVLSSNSCIIKDELQLL